MIAQRRYFKTVCFIPRFISETYLSLSLSESNKLQLQSPHIHVSELNLQPWHMLIIAGKLCFTLASGGPLHNDFTGIGGVAGST